MKLNVILERLPIWYESRRCFYLRSAPGRGKTTTILRAPEIISKALGWDIKDFGIVVVNAALLTPMDVLGFGVPKHSEKHTVMMFSRPNFWITSEGKLLEEYKGGIIFFDEIDKADVDVKKCIGEGAYSGRFGPHQLPPGWVVWMAGNREKDRSGSTKELDHLINRQTILEVTDDIESWERYAVETGVSNVTIAFALNNPQIVWKDELPKVQGPYCTPRSLCALDAYMQLLEQRTGEDVDSPTFIEEAQGFIGPDDLGQFLATLRLNKEMPKYEDIIRDPMKAKCPEKPDGQMLVCYNLAARVKAGAEAAAVLKYVDRMPKDFAATFARSAIRRDYSLVMDPAFSKWASMNASLMEIISKK